MPKDRKITVRGEGKNLYKISEYDGWFYAYHVDVGVFSDSNNSIGKTRSLKDSLELIRVHSGREIASID
jgi:hypothetical protein